MSKTRDNVVTLGTKGNKKDITKEPEMKELKRMIREGELDQERTLEHLRQKQDNSKGCSMPFCKKDRGLTP